MTWGTQAGVHQKKLKKETMKSTGLQEKLSLREQELDLAHAELVELGDKKDKSIDTYMDSL